MRGQKGITLVALVVTIVVLLILAGVSIAMLDGDNGIITNAQKAKFSNEEADVLERIGLAYNSAKTHVMVQSALTDGYNPNKDANVTSIAALVASDLDATVITTPDAPVTNGYNVYVVDADADDGVKEKVVVLYGSNAFALDADVADPTTNDNIYQNIKAEFVLTANDVTYSAPARKVQ